MNLKVNDETAILESVVLGIGIDRGEPRPINPKIRMHLANNSLPTDKDICHEISTFEKILKDNGVEVLSPSNIPALEQIFTRDIGFVIEDKFFISNMKHPVRSEELPGIDYILEKIDSTHQINIPKEIIVEGGDVILKNDYIFVGLGDRTSDNAIEYLQDIFPNKKVLGFDLVVDQDNSGNNILHLDCCFQPIGTNEAIIYPGGFKKTPQELLDIYSKENLIEVDRDEKIKMFPNIFSIAPNKVVIEKGFTRLKDQLQERNYQVFEVDYSETSKLGGLLRCSTLPLRRK